MSFLTLMMIKVNSEDQVGPALKKMLVVSSALMAIVMLFVTKAMLPDTFEIGGKAYTDFKGVGGLTYLVPVRKAPAPPW